MIANLRNATQSLAQGLLVLAVAACGAAAAIAVRAGQPASAATTPISSNTGTNSNPTTSSTTSSCPAPNPPNELLIAGGTPQTAQLDAVFASTLQVTLANTNGCPITTSLIATVVTFSAPASGATGTFQASGSNTITIGTDAQATASAGTFTANDTAGAYTVTASSAYGSVSFTLTNTAAGMPATITPLAPTSQSTLIDAPYSTPLEVRVLDANGLPVVGATVSFSLGTNAGGSGNTGTTPGGGSTPGAGATFAAGSTQVNETTNSDGITNSPSLSANSTPGGFTATASVTGVTQPASFELRNLTGRLRHVGRAQRSATINSNYREPLKVRVLSTGQRPVVGATVTFMLGSSTSSGNGSGATASAGVVFASGGTQATATTAANGVATSPRFTANSTAGTLTATATLQGTNQTTSFRLHNLTGAITRLGQLERSAVIDSSYREPLRVRVLTAGRHPVAGAIVTFSLGTSSGAGGNTGTTPGGGGSTSGAGATFAAGSTQATATTNSHGIATSPRFTANSTAGTLTATAALQGTNQTTSFRLRNLTGMIDRVGQLQRSATINSNYREPLKVRVLSTGQRPVVGATVTFTLGSSTSSGNGSGATASAGVVFASGGTQTTATTAANGVATSPRFTANSTAGTLTATATLQGTNQTTSFRLHNLTGAITRLGQLERSAVIDSSYREPLRVRVLTAGRHPVAGAIVTFSLGTSSGAGGNTGTTPGGGGSTSGAGATFAAGSTQATATTNSHGIATSPRFTANSTAGTLTATAALQGTNQTTSFRLRNLTGMIDRVGQLQRSATINSNYREPLKVRVLSTGQRPVVGATVTFTLGSSTSSGNGSGATASAGVVFASGGTQATATTAANGVATSPRFTANSTVGTLTATATVQGTDQTASFELRNLSGPPVQITAGVAASESARNGMRFTVPLAVTVTDAHGNDVAGAAVTFAAPASGPSGTFATHTGHPTTITARTDSSGIALSPAFTANNQSGGYIVTATVHGVDGVWAAAFALLNTPS